MEYKDFKKVIGETLNTERLFYSLFNISFDHSNLNFNQFNPDQIPRDIEEFKSAYKQTMYSSDQYTPLFNEIDEIIAKDILDKYKNEETIKKIELVLSISQKLSYQSFESAFSSFLSNNNYGVPWILLQYIFLSDKKYAELIKRLATNKVLFYGLKQRFQYDNTSEEGSWKRQLVALIFLIHQHELKHIIPKSDLDWLLSLDLAKKMIEEKFVVNDNEIWMKITLSYLLENKLSASEDQINSLLSSSSLDSNLNEFSIINRLRLNIKPTTITGEDLIQINQLVKNPISDGESLTLSDLRSKEFKTGLNGDILLNSYFSLLEVPLENVNFDVISILKNPDLAYSFSSKYKSLQRLLPTIKELVQDSTQFNLLYTGSYDSVSDINNRIQQNNYKDKRTIILMRHERYSSMGDCAISLAKDKDYEPNSSTLLYDVDSIKLREDMIVDNKERINYPTISDYDSWWFSHAIYTYEKNDGYMHYVIYEYIGN